MTGTVYERPPDQTIAVFGASGDLTSRKLVPALYALYREGLLPDRWRVVGYARSPGGNDAFRQRMREAVEDRGDFTPERWERFAACLHYVRGDYDDMSGLPGALDALEAPRRCLFYCATPPSGYTDVVEGLGRTGLAERGGIVVEKPFGSDLPSARELNEQVHRVFDEDQVFRIDHYLGKETVMNILVFRFANGLFEPIWDRRYVSRVEITVAEDAGVGHRGGFYEEAGALRDIVQNHIFQVLTFLAMEPPVSFQPEALRTEKAKVLDALRPVEPDEVVRGQYEGGRIDDEDVPGYLDEEGVAPDSRTETFVAMRLRVDNWRWAGVPFFVRTGKRLPRRVTEVTMTFTDAPHSLFEHGPEPNHLTIRIQPHEGICLSFGAKVPGPEMRIAPVRMDFQYDEHFAEGPPEAYERLLRDAMLGDHTLFPRADEVEAAWEVLQPVLDAPPHLEPYPAGTWGPKGADDLVAPEVWHVS